MTDDARRASERFRGLQRWTGGKDQNGPQTPQSSWFAPEDSGDSAPGTPDPRPGGPHTGTNPGVGPGPVGPGTGGQPAVGPQAGGTDRRSPEQRYADAIAAMNQIVSTLDFSNLPWVTEVFRSTAGVLREDDPARAGVLNNLGSAAQLRYVQSRDLADLEDAIGYYRSATTSAHSGDRDRILYFCNLALALTDLAGKTGRPQIAADGAQVARDAVAQTPKRDQRRPMVLLRLANALKLHAQLADSAESDEESIAVFREAARISPASDPTTPELLINLGAALMRRYQRAHDQDDLDEAVKHLSTGAGALPDGDGRRSGLCRYAEALRLRFQRNGDLTDLNNAINELIGVLGVLEAGNPQLGMTVWQLAAATVEHVDATGEAGQLRRVLRPIAPAVRAMAAEDTHRSLALGGYAILLRRHFLHGGETKALDTAVTAGEAAVEAAAPSRRARVLTALNTSLLVRYEHGESGDDLDRAAELAREAAKDSDPQTQHIAWVQLGVVLAHRFQRAGRAQDVETAIELFDQALIAMPETTPGRAAVSIQLALALQGLHQRTGRRRYYRWARKVLTEAAGQANAPAEQRLRAAALAGRISAQEQRWSEALESFTTAVELLPLMTRGKRVVASPSAQQRWASIVADAAASAIEAGEPNKAVELIEHGRSAILADFLPSGGELGELHREHPALADEVVRLRRLLDRPAEDPDLDDGDNRQRLADAWAALVDEVREIQPTHLRLRPFSELCGVGGDGSVAIVNLSRYRSDVLVIFGGRVLTVPIPHATPDKAGEQTLALLSAAQQDDHATIADVLDWTWVRLVRPVLDRMGYLNTPAAGSRWPRVWWSCFGAAAYLPLHAATAHAGASALDRVVSSYTPTLGCLLRARTRPVPEGGALVAAGSAEQVSRELPPQNQVLAQHWPTAEIVSTESASATDVLRMLPSFPWVHICEPSSQFPGQPAAGMLLDRDGQRPLGLVELGQVALDKAEFCYLGQIATAADQPCAAGLSLVAALGFAGFTHVIGTLWEVDPAGAVAAHADFYSAVFGPEGYGTDGAAYALHNAAREIRNARPHDCAAWSAHVHVGP
ncbi:CHAT domain-containing protein [Saccharopolyspora rhizosphaerae]|uniref:CHAT domain-containing protein n=1 Tax=Saccharopolyspora rhizosphaerae TaxID=2492662 RepID=A0A426JIJ7_9PSEU|nr:CHAT domain-containing protein [Saccharopolyspora rhizosphaerae]RRO12988.1 CHAT domain-containing protein [Saccharopolyspora rhizosphaerae]